MSDVCRFVNESIFKSLAGPVVHLVVKRTNCKRIELHGTDTGSIGELTQKFEIHNNQILNTQMEVVDKVVDKNQNTKK